MIVEMDESLFGKLKYGKGSAAQRRRKWVFGGKCRETGRVFLALCPKNKRTKKSLWPIILKNVKIGSVLHTDGCLLSDIATAGWTTQSTTFTQMIQVCTQMVSRESGGKSNAGFLRVVDTTLNSTSICTIGLKIKKLRRKTHFGL